LTETWISFFPIVIYTTFFQRREGEKNHKRELLFAIDVKGGEKEQKHEDMGAHEYKGSIGHRGSMSVSINAKGGDYWKIGCH
jgi:hypothetical protein